MREADAYAANPGAVIPLNRAWMALTTDIITEYLAKSYDQLESPSTSPTPSTRPSSPSTAIRN